MARVLLCDECNEPIDGDYYVIQQVKTGAIVAPPQEPGRIYPRSPVAVGTMRGRGRIGDMMRAREEAQAPTFDLHPHCLISLAQRTTQEA